MTSLSYNQSADNVSLFSEFLCMSNWETDRNALKESSYWSRYFHFVRRPSFVVNLFINKMKISWILALSLYWLTEVSEPMKHPIGTPRDSRDKEVFSLAILQSCGKLPAEKIKAKWGGSKTVISMRWNFTTVIQCSNEVFRVEFSTGCWIPNWYYDTFLSSTEPSFQRISRCFKGFETLFSTD